MNIKLNDSYVSGFVPAKDVDAIAPELDKALASVKDGSGAGNDFLGWRDLPVDYDKDEFARIKAAAERIRNNSEILVVIGIGGSYLGAKGAIERIVAEGGDTVAVVSHGGTIRYMLWALTGIAPGAVALLSNCSFAEIEIKGERAVLKQYGLVPMEASSTEAV